MKTVTEFPAFNPALPGAVFVAGGDLTGNGSGDVIAGVGEPGGPQVTAVFGASQTLASFFAYDPAFLGGVHVGAVDANGDGRDDIITGTGAFPGPQVKVIDALTLATLDSFFAFNPQFDGGVFVAGG